MKKTGETKKASGINVRLLCKVSAAIHQAPEFFDMGFWHRSRLAPETPEGETATACIAGWVMAIRGRKKLCDLQPGVIPQRAAELLGLNIDQAERLFYLFFWPAEIKEVYRNTPETLEDYENNARLAGERIDIFIQTNGER